MVTPTNKPPIADADEDDFEEPIAEADVPEDVLAEFYDDLDGEIARWSEEVEAQLNKQRTNGDG